MDSKIHYSPDMVCPYCGARFSGRVVDEKEFEEEEDELEAWDEEDGL